jgi:hypothetical protein
MVEKSCTSASKPRPNSCSIDSYTIYSSRRRTTASLNGSGGLMGCPASFESCTRAGKMQSSPDLMPCACQSKSQVLGCENKVNANNAARFNISSKLRLRSPFSIRESANGRRMLSSVLAAAWTLPLRPSDAVNGSRTYEPCISSAVVTLHLASSDEVCPIEVLVGIDAVLVVMLTWRSTVFVGHLLETTSYLYR